jgi:hypothetical protein
MIIVDNVVWLGYMPLLFMQAYQYPIEKSTIRLFDDNKEKKVRLIMLL